MERTYIYILSSNICKENSDIDISAREHRIFKKMANLRKSLDTPNLGN